eukprot:gene11684-15645_t
MSFVQRSQSNLNKNNSLFSNISSADEHKKKPKHPSQMKSWEFLDFLKAKDFADIAFYIQDKLMRKTLNVSSFDFFSYFRSPDLLPELKRNSIKEYHQKRFIDAVHRNQYNDHHNISNDDPDVTEKKIFNFVKNGDEDGLNNFIKNANKQTGSDWKEENDSAGANIIHLAYLFERYEMGRSLVKKYPLLALKPYSDNISPEIRREFDVLCPNTAKYHMPYVGENILHMVIIRREYEEVKWLLTFFEDTPAALRTLLMQEATGYMFTPTAEFYFGSHPFHFAVCSNDINICDLVLRFTSTLNFKDYDDGQRWIDSEKSATSVIIEHKDGGSMSPARKRTTLGELQSTSTGPHVIFMRDSFGNNALHLCVHHCLPDMYKHILKTAETILRTEIRLLYKNEYETAKLENNFTKVFSIQNISDVYMKCNTGLLPMEKTLTLPSDPKRKTEWIDSETKLKLEERLLNVLNKDLHSPLTLAASQANHRAGEGLLKKQEEMVRVLIESSLAKQWVYGPTKCNYLLLEGLDIKYEVNDWYELESGYELDEQENNIIKKKVHNICNITEDMTESEVARVLAENKAVDESLRARAYDEKKKKILNKIDYMKSAIHWIC